MKVVLPNQSFMAPMFPNVLPVICASMLLLFHYFREVYSLPVLVVNLELQSNEFL